MFKKLLAKFGKGAAKIDLVLDQDHYALGDEIHGQIRVHGGKIKQSINKIKVDLNMVLQVGEHSYTQLIHHYEVQESFEIRPSEEKTFSFHFQVPYNLLISGNAVHYYFRTHLDIDSGKDSSDQDHLVILPHKRMQNIFTALQNLGFVETKSSRNYDGYFQEFEFAPTDLFKSELEEIEFNIISEEEGILLLLELDCYSFLGEKETSLELWLENQLLEDVEALTAHLQQTIEKVIQDPSSYHGEKKQFQKKYYLAAGAVGGVAVGLVAAEVLDEVKDFVEDIIEDDDDDEDGIFDEDEEGDWFDEED